MIDLEAIKARALENEDFSCKPGSDCCAMCSLLSCDCREWKIKAALKAARADIPALIARVKELEGLAWLGRKNIGHTHKEAVDIYGCGQCDFISQYRELCGPVPGEALK